MIEPGKYYKTKAGYKVKILRRTGLNEYSGMFEKDGEWFNNIWTGEGESLATFLDNEKGQMNLTVFKS